MSREYHLLSLGVLEEDKYLTISFSCECDKEVSVTRPCFRHERKCMRERQHAEVDQLAGDKYGVLHHGDLAGEEQPYVERAGGSCTGHVVNLLVLLLAFLLDVLLLFRHLHLLVTTIA